MFNWWSLTPSLLPNGLIKCRSDKVSVSYPPIYCSPVELAKVCTVTVQSKTEVRTVRASLFWGTDIWRLIKKNNQMLQYVWDCNGSTFAFNAGVVAEPIVLSSYSTFYYIEKSRITKFNQWIIIADTSKFIYSISLYFWERGAAITPSILRIMNVSIFKIDLQDLCFLSFSLSPKGYSLHIQLPSFYYQWHNYARQTQVIAVSENESQN